MSTTNHYEISHRSCLGTVIIETEATAHGQPQSQKPQKRYSSSDTLIACKCSVLEFSRTW